MGLKYKPKTIANTISLLSSSYDRAVRTGMLADNPCTRATLPKRKKKEISTLSKEDIIKLLNALENERLDFKVAYKLCLFCGLRRSEVLGIKEEDVNLMFKTVSINKSRHFVDGKMLITETKTERSHRTLAIPSSVVDDIEELIKLHHSVPYNNTDFLIQDGFGEPLNPSTLGSRIATIEEKAGIEHVSVHGLRHTFASLLNAEGIDIARISAELGHSNITTTLNVYTHVFGNTTASSRGIANTIDTIFESSGTFEAPRENKKA